MIIRGGVLDFGVPARLLHEFCVTDPTVDEGLWASGEVDNTTGTVVRVFAVTQHLY